MENAWSECPGQPGCNHLWIRGGLFFTSTYHILQIDVKSNLDPLPQKDSGNQSANFELFAPPKTLGSCYGRSGVSGVVSLPKKPRTHRICRLQKSFGPFELAAFHEILHHRHCHPANFFSIKNGPRVFCLGPWVSKICDFFFHVKNRMFVTFHMCILEKKSHKTTLIDVGICIQ